MSTKHTPGPWRFQEGQDSCDLLRLIGADDSLVCHFGNSEQYYPSEGSEPNEANARLIAAAPDLLAALEALLSAHLNWKWVPMKAATIAAAKLAHDAIAKAKGIT